VLVGPVTLLPRFNPVATTGPVPVLQQQPSPADPRQRLPINAAWTVGRIAALARRRCAVLFETTGPSGLLDAGSRFPVYEVLTALAGYAGGELLHVDAPPGLAALGVRLAGRALVLLSNSSPSPSWGGAPSGDGCRPVSMPCGATRLCSCRGTPWPRSRGPCRGDRRPHGPRTAAWLGAWGEG
jgi:hypothetical protein